MLLKKASNNSAIIFAIIITLLLTLLYFREFSLVELKADLDELFLSYNSSYSRIPELNQLSKDLLENNIDLVLGIPNKLNFETLYIDVNPEEYRAILSDRSRAIDNNVLINPQEVNAKLRFDGRQESIKIRLKGDLSDHWLSKRRMSLRIKVKNDGSVLGFNEFSIQKPASRQHPYDSVFQNLVKQSGNLSSSREYVNVIFNGEAWGVMNMEEAMSSEFLEKARKKESLILRFSSEEKGVIEIQNYESQIPFYEEYRLSDERLYIKIYEERKYAVNEVARKWYTYIAQERVKDNQENSKIYNINSYSQVLFLACFWNDGHALWHANSRHYFNPYTLKLEPITTDSSFPVPILASRQFFPRRIFHPLMNNSIYNSIIRMNAFNEGFSENFDTSYSAVLYAKSSYDYYQKLFPLDLYEDEFLRALDENIQIISQTSVKEALFSPSPLDSYELIQPPTPEQSALLTDHVHVRHYENGNVGLFNLLPVPIKVSRIFLDNLREIKIDKEIPPYREGHYDEITIKTEFKGVLDGRLHVETEYEGSRRSTISGLTLAVDNMENPLLKDNGKEFSFIEKNNDGNWEIGAGIWDVTSPIIIEGDLKIGANTRLQFNDNAYLIVKGALHVLGTQNEPVEFVALNESWKGVYVLGDNESSKLKFASFEAYTALEDGLLSLTGGLTFYQAKVILEDVTLINSLGEDALNLIESDFLIDHLSVNGSVSDAVDSDFSTGVINNSSFSNVSGDAIDFSGSSVALTNISANNIFDKAISVGESSVVSIDGGNFQNIGVGVVSKDGSSTTANDLVIKDYVLAAAMSYTKKSFYAEPSIELSNIQVLGETPFVRQNGSAMLVDGLEVEAQALDVDNLYENTVMRK